MKKKSKAYQEGYDYMYMIGRDNTKEIKAYFKKFNLNPYKKDNWIDFVEWNPYTDIKNKRKQYLDFIEGYNTAYDEMEKFNEELELLDDPKEWLYNDSAWEAIGVMYDFLKYVDNNTKEDKKEIARLQKLIEIYVKGLEAEREFFKTIEIRGGYEI
jgi:hypothetical protein